MSLIQRQDFIINCQFLLDCYCIIHVFSFPLRCKKLTRANRCNIVIEIVAAFERVEVRFLRADDRLNVVEVHENAVFVAAFEIPREVKKEEPLMRFELMTPGLQDQCSNH